VTEGLQHIFRVLKWKIQTSTKNHCSLNSCLNGGAIYTEFEYLIPYPSNRGSFLKSSTFAYNEIKNKILRGLEREKSWRI
jgi:hypothetical protein